MIAPRTIGGILVLALLTGACARLETGAPAEPEQPSASATYRWSSFFNQGCGETIWVRLNGESAGVLDYNCPEGDIGRQDIRLHREKDAVQFWAADRLSNEDLYRLSNAKCQATIVVLGPDHATIHYRCALIQLTVGYTVVDRLAFEDETTEMQLRPQQVLITYTDGTQKFKVQDDSLVPAEPFMPFKSGPEPDLTL